MADGGDQLETLRKIVSKFPQGIALAFAYGSGVFTQNGNISPATMIDFVFVVEDSSQWHRENLILHRTHYSFLGNFGASTIVSVQDGSGARVYYNTLVPFDGRMIKYGVISVNDFLKDMNSWLWLYTSGRLHKPVQIIQLSDGKPISRALRGNLSSALRTALLCLPGDFSEEDLFMTISGLSYAGDFRMIIGEDKGKVKKIVHSNFEGFQELYRPLIAASADINISDTSKQIQQSLHRDRTYDLLKSLPSNVLQNIIKATIRQVNSGDIKDDALYDISKDRAKCSKLVNQGVAAIVLRSSITQSAKGILTAGLMKTCAYSAQKVRKMFRGIIR